MTTDKLFNVVGVSDLNGIYKVRFANDLTRVKVLDKNGHKDVRLIQLPDALSKREAVEAIKDHPNFQDASAQMVIGEFLTNEDAKGSLNTARERKVTSSAPKAPRAKKEKKFSADADALEQARAVAARMAVEEIANEPVEDLSLEDQPY